MNDEGFRKDVLAEWRLTSDGNNVNLFDIRGHLPICSFRLDKWAFGSFVHMLWQSMLEPHSEDTTPFFFIKGLATDDQNHKRPQVVDYPRQALEGGMWGSTRKKTVKMCVFQYVSVSSGKLQRITALIQMELISPCLP